MLSVRLESLLKLLNNGQISVIYARVNDNNQSM